MKLLLISSLLITSFSAFAIYSYSVSYFDGKGILRSPKKPFFDAHGYIRNVGDKYYDYEGHLRGPRDPFFDSKGQYRIRGDYFYDGNGYLRKP